MIFSSNSLYKWRQFFPVALILVTIMTLAGCGGGGGEAETNTISPGPNPAETLLEGRAADGYLVNATVFLDRNGNKLPDANEPQSRTGGGGSFSLAVLPGEGSLFPVVIQVVPGQTYDEDVVAPIIYGYILEAPIGRHAFISPLTTLVKQELDKNAILKVDDAEILVRTRFGLDDTISLWGDYVISSRAAVGGEPWARAHQTARILAELNGLLLEEFRLNLGGTISAADYPAATAVVGDLMMIYGTGIALAMGNTVTPLASSGSKIVDEFLAKIDLTTLNLGMLQKYRKLLAERPEVWDAIPPSIVARTPIENTVGSVSTTVTVTFNEPLDPASLGTTPISLQGNGKNFAGQTTYDAAQNRLSFVPAERLFAMTEFMVEVSADISDVHGNTLGTPQTWAFSTLFNLTPPALPIF